MTLKLYWPVENLTRGFNQAYGANPQIYAQWGLSGHEGIDFYAPHGSKIFACMDGVVKVVNAPGLTGYSATHNYGIHVRVAHADGYETIYAHFERATVSVGDTVKASQIIGIADSTGNSTGSHLHLTLKHNGVIIDPTPYLVREFVSSWQTPPEPQTVGCDAVTTVNLNVRSEPDTSKSNVLFTTAIGAALSPTHQFIARGENWYRVRYTNNGVIGIGWVVARLTKRAANCPVLPVWEEPTPDPLPEPEPEEWPTHPPAEPAPSEEAEVIAELMPVFREIQAGALTLQERVMKAERIFEKYVERKE